MNNKDFIAIITELTTNLIKIWEYGKPPAHMENWGPHYTFPGSERPVSIGKIEAYFLHNIISCIHPLNVFEIGTGFGYSSWWIGHAMRRKGWFGSIDNFSEGKLEKERITFIKEAISKLELKKILYFYKAESPLDLPAIIQNRKLDAIFIDGHHYENAPINDFSHILEYTHKDSTIIMHDVQKKYTVNHALAYAEEHQWFVKRYITSCGIAICCQNKDFFSLYDKAYNLANQLILL